MVFGCFFSPPGGVRYHRIDSWMLQSLIAKSLPGTLGFRNGQRLFPLDASGERFSPSHLDRKSAEHIVLQAKPPARFIALLIKKTSTALRQPFSTVFSLGLPGLLTGADIDVGTVGIVCLISDCLNILKGFPMLGWPLIRRCVRMKGYSMSFG